MPFIHRQMWTELTPVRFNNVYWIMTQMKDKSNIKDKCVSLSNKDKTKTADSHQKLNKSRSLRPWVFCMFAFFRCLLCANVYACVCDPVSITFYRLVDKSIFLTSIAAAASKKGWPPVMGIHSKLLSHQQQQSMCSHGKSFFTSCTLHVLFPKV